jgi:mono/diheme cytochrome c family protein
MRYFLAILLISIAAVIGVLGFQGTHFRKPPLYIFPDMEWQLKLRPQKPSGFFANGRTSQLPVAGTIPRSAPIKAAAGDVYPYEEAPVAGTTNFVEVNPMPITAAMVKRGQQRYTINCSPCHGQLADGNGITKKIGAMALVANLHDARIVTMTDGELFYVITNGRNQMGAYGANVAVEDRWAVVAYLRALQFSQLGTIDDVPEPLRASLKK